MPQLTAWQEFLSKRFPGSGNAPSIDELNQAAQEFFGNIPLPTGVDESSVVTRTGGYVDYKDQDGFVHRITRELDGRSPLVGTVRMDLSPTGTNRPASVPIPGEQQAAHDLLGTLTQKFAGPNTNMDYWMGVLKDFTNKLGQQATLGQLDPAAQAALATINANEQAQLRQQFQQDQGHLVAQLFGTGTNRSSMAGQQAGQMLQQQGLVTSQQQANAAQRELAIRQFLAQLGQGNLALGSQNALGGAQTGIQDQNSLANFVSDLFKNSVNRDAINAQDKLGNAQLAETQRQYNNNQQQAYVQFQEQMRQLERQNTINNIFRGVSTAASILTGIPGLFGGANPGAQGTPGINQVSQGLYQGGGTMGTGAPPLYTYQPYQP